MRKFKRMIARANMKRAGYTRLNKKGGDGRSTFAKLWKQYIEEKCQKQDDVKTRAKTLYDNYKLWCKSNGYYVCSMKKFNAELMAHPEWYEQKSVSGGVAVYYGIMMKTTG